MIDQQPSRTTRPASPEPLYRERCARFAAQRDRYDRLSHRLANTSLLLFITTLLVVGVSLWQGTAWLAFLAIALGVAFMASYSYHYHVDQQFRHFSERWAINDEGLLRLARRWATLPLRQPQIGSDNPLVYDLDVEGHASLYHLIGTPATTLGRQTLQQWLLTPATPSVVQQRQRAVAELAPQIELRDELALRGRLLGATPPDPEPFLRWAESKPWLIQRRWLLWTARVTPLAIVITVVLQMIGTLAYPIWLVLVVINMAISLSIGRRVDVIVDKARTRRDVFFAYADLIELIAQQAWSAPLLRQLQQQLTASGQRADLQMPRLGRIMAAADLRTWMLFPIIQYATLWSVHVLWLLERWQHDAGIHVREWLAALSEVEALAALATLKHDHPAWTFPEIASGEANALYARNLGHPLLAPSVCVGNDVEIGPPGTFLLVTGSNMSGKSTLLRAIGLNVLLAQAGGPVCADRMELPPVELATSMRVQDSLEQGVSYFMAELQRLKAVVDQAQRVGDEGQRTLLFLLDEILHGTNTSERQIAARQIIHHLLSLGAMGAVSTHDLMLADEPELAARSVSVHFTETFVRDQNGPRMTFDYTLRPGIATSTNALKLMELIGLPVEDDVVAHDGPVDR